MFEIIITAGLLIFILWVLFSQNKTTERYAKAINMSVFSIKSIDHFVDELGLLDVFRAMHLKGWNRFLYGDPYLVLEKIIEDGKTRYYIAIPKKYEEVLEKNQYVQKVESEIIPKNKDYCFLHLHKKRPLIRFGDLKLYDDEGLVLQVLARHVHDRSNHFESNVRVMSWAGSSQRASRIIGFQKSGGRASRKAAFDFFSRIFEDRQRVKLSFAQLKDFLINKFAY